MKCEHYKNDNTYQGTGYSCGKCHAEHWCLDCEKCNACEFSFDDVEDPPANTLHPMQPVNFDGHGVIRFKENKIVRFLLDAGQFDLNQLCLMNWDSEDWIQFYQLIGYSVSGFGDLENLTGGYQNKRFVRLLEKPIKMQRI